MPDLGLTFGLRELLIVAASWGSASVHLMAIVLVWSLPGLTPLLRRRFTLFFLAPAWYCVVAGPSFADVLLAYPRFMNLSQLVTGYTGVFLFQLTRALLHPNQPQQRWERWLYLGGVPGTVLALVVLASADPAALVRAYFERDYAMHPLLSALWTLHGVQLVGFVVATAAVAIRARRSAASERARARAFWAAGPIAAVGLATAVSVLIPMTPVGASLRGLGPVFTTPMALAAMGAARFAARELEALQREREHMARYLPREVVSRIGAGEQRVELGGERAVATVLFTDLRGFTTLSEGMSPEEVVQLLNEHLGALAQVVLEHGGMVDKFIGDALLAVFGVPDGDDDARRAVSCAVAMGEVVAEANRARATEGRPPLAIGIGLARGPLVHGNIGSPQRMEYTVVGDTVNVASRVESLTKELGEALLVTESVVAAVGESGQFEQVCERTLRGRATPTRLFKVVR